MPQVFTTDTLNAFEPDVPEAHIAPSLYWDDCDYEGEEDLDINDD